MTTIESSPGRTRVAARPSSQVCLSSRPARRADVPVWLRRTDALCGYGGAALACSAARWGSCTPNVLAFLTRRHVGTGAGIAWISLVDTPAGGPIALASGSLIAAFIAVWQAA